MHIHALATLAALLSLSVAGSAHAGTPVTPTAPAAALTTTEYAALCRHQDAARKVRYTGPCDGVLEHATDQPRAPQRYLFTLPDKTELVVMLYPNGLASVNGLPARRTPSLKGTVRLQTAEDEEVMFTEVGSGIL